MKINKLFWIFGLILVLSSTLVLAQGIVGSISGFFRSAPVIFFINALIIWSILFIAQLFIIPNQDTKVKVVVWIVTLVAAILIAWNFFPYGSPYMWEGGAVGGYLKFWIAVNTIIFAIAAYFIAGFLGINPQTNPGKIGLILGALLLGGMIAYSMGDVKLWDTKNYSDLKKYLLGPEEDITRADGTKQKVGGILTLDKANIFESRLFIFIISTILFAWFFTAYLNLQQNPKMTYLMAFIVGANLARTGTTSGTLIGIGEAFAILIIGGQVAHNFKGIWGWLIGIILVEWIFCAVFNQSRILAVLGEVVKALLQSGVLTIVITLYIISVVLRSISLTSIIIGGVAVLSTIVNYFTGLVGSGIAKAINIDVCKLLAQHTIIAGASSGTAKAAGVLGGGLSLGFGGYSIPSVVMGGALILGLIVMSFKLWQLRSRIIGH